MEYYYHYADKKYKHITKYKHGVKMHKCINNNKNSKININVKSFHRSLTTVVKAQKHSNLANNH